MEGNNSVSDLSLSLDAAVQGRTLRGSTPGISFRYDSGSLYRSVNGQREALLTAALPLVEWYDLVEFAQSPENPDELWLALAGRELFLSRNGGATFEQIKGVNAIADITFVPSQRENVNYMVFLTGQVEGRGRGNYVSWDHGSTWCPFDLLEYLPLA